MTTSPRAPTRRGKAAFVLLALPLALSLTACGGGGSFSGSSSPPAAVSPRLSPASGATGTPVTITGAGFTGATAVNFAGTPGTDFSVNAAGTQITVTAPTGTGTVAVTVVEPTGPVSVGSYSYIPTVTYTYQSQFGNTGSGQLSEPQEVELDSAGKRLRRGRWQRPRRRVQQRRRLQPRLRQRWRSNCQLPLRHRSQLFR